MAEALQSAPAVAASGIVGSAAAIGRIIGRSREYWWRGQCAQLREEGDCQWDPRPAKTKVHAEPQGPQIQRQIIAQSKVLGDRHPPGDGRWLEDKIDAPKVMAG